MPRRPAVFPPTLPGDIGDNVTAITLVARVHGGLFSRERSGLGQLASTSLLRTGIFFVSMEMSARLAIKWGRTVTVTYRATKSLDEFLTDW